MKDFEDGISARYHALVTSAPVRAKKQYCYPGAVEHGQVDGVGVEFFGDGVEAWFGTFAAGSISPNALDVGIHHPNPWKACIVSKGDGYIVDVRDPSDWAEIALRPIMGVLAVADRGVVIFWDFTRFLAIGTGGVLWRTPRLSWDGIRAVRVEGDCVIAEVWGSVRTAWLQTTIEIATGSHSGGASPAIGKPQGT